MQFIDDDIDLMVSGVESCEGGTNYVFIDCSMSEAEQEMDLFAGFLREGYSPEEAAQKAKDFLQLSILARAPMTLPN
jgi:hypothetical protein